MTYHFRSTKEFPMIGPSLPVVIC